MIGLGKQDGWEHAEVYIKEAYKGYGVASTRHNKGRVGLQVWSQQIQQAQCDKRKWGASACERVSIRSAQCLDGVIKRAQRGPRWGMSIKQEEVMSKWCWCGCRCGCGCGWSKERIQESERGSMVWAYLCFDTMFRL